MNTRKIISKFFIATIALLIISITVSLAESSDGNIYSMTPNKTNVVAEDVVKVDLKVNAKKFSRGTQGRIRYDENLTFEGFEMDGKNVVTDYDNIQKTVDTDLRIVGFAAAADEKKYGELAVATLYFKVTGLEGGNYSISWSDYNADGSFQDISIITLKRTDILQTEDESNGNTGNAGNTGNTGDNGNSTNPDTEIDSGTNTNPDGDDSTNNNDNPENNTQTTPDTNVDTETDSDSNSDLDDDVIIGIIDPEDGENNTDEDTNNETENQTGNQSGSEDKNQTGNQNANQNGNEDKSQTGNQNTNQNVSNQSKDEQNTLTPGSSSNNSQSSNNITNENANGIYTPTDNDDSNSLPKTGENTYLLVALISAMALVVCVYLRIKEFKF